MNPDLPIYLRIDPVALQLGPLSIHWYGVMYLLAFLAFWWLGKRRTVRMPELGWKQADPGDFLFYAMLGVIIGGRLGYTLVYSMQSLLDDPLFLFKINQGGMSFHGGLLGVLLVSWLYGRKKGWGFWGVTDFIAPMVPIGLMLGRIGNFIGGELWGRHSDVSWAMIFPNALEYQGWKSESLYQLYLSGALNAETRHPSQLYQAALEGLLLFIILWLFSSKPRPRAAVSGLFLLGYGFFRSMVEHFRQPDEHISFIAFDWLTMGQLLSVPMLIAGAILLLWSYKAGKKQNRHQ